MPDTGIVEQFAVYRQPPSLRGNYQQCRNTFTLKRNQVTLICILTL